MNKMKALIVGALPGQAELIRQSCKGLPVEFDFRKEYMSHDKLPICDFVIIWVMFMSSMCIVRTDNGSRTTRVVYYRKRGMSGLKSLVHAMIQECLESRAE